MAADECNSLILLHKIITDGHRASPKASTTYRHFGRSLFAITKARNRENTKER
jgi:hypothetical protein